jgi:hypothetical protein
VEAWSPGEEPLGGVAVELPPPCCIAVKTGVGLDAWEMGDVVERPAGNHGVEWPSIREPLQGHRLKEIPSRRVGINRLDSEAAFCERSNEFTMATSRRRATMAELERRGLRAESRFGVPHGPWAAFRAAGGQRLAVYELTRPRADARLGGRHDFGRGSG